MKIHWIHTSDVHGDFQSLRAIESRVDSLRKEHGPQSVILTDGGDTLQGSPLLYYYNHIDTSAPHIVATTMNRMAYDCMALGNHDIEMGHQVYDRVLPQMNFPVLCANIKDYFSPYIILRKGNLRIAILSLITPSTPRWMSPSQYSGLQFLPPVQSAREWIDHIRQHETYDLLVGLFHLGWDETSRIAAEVPEFDFILYGHDHHQAIHRVGKTLCAAPSSLATSCVHLTIDGNTLTSAEIIPTPPQSDSPQHLPSAYTQWLNQPLATIDHPLHEFDSYFAPSAFMTLIHRLQLSATHADVSLASPITYDAHIPSGTLTNRDLFTLYSRDSQLYTLRLTTDEIRGILEYSYSLWVQKVTTPDDHALLLDYVLDNGTRLGIKNPIINFLSAYGLSYTVNLLNDTGNRITILHTPPHTTYLSVAINSYHANGGGEVLTRGTGLSPSALREREVSIAHHDLRQCLANELRQLAAIHPIIPISPSQNWSFIPTDLAHQCLRQDREIIKDPLRPTATS